MDIKGIKELIELVKETDISEFNLETDGTKIVIKKGTTGEIEMETEPSQKQDIEKNHQDTVDNEGNSKTITEQENADIEYVKSPMVGTFYRAPGPDKEPFVKEGDTIKEGDTLCIIEAMKLMNEINSELNGKINRILVENGEMVEYGQKLFEIVKK